MPDVIVIAGPNGAGKSTLAPHLLRDAFGIVEYVNADTIAQGLSAFAPENAAFEAGRVMLNRLNELARQGRDFAFETTLASRFYARWLSALRLREYNIHLVFLWLNSVDLAIERVHERVINGGHDIPEETIRRRFERGSVNFIEVYRPIVDSWQFFDASTIQPEEIAIGDKINGTKVINEELWLRIEK
jgi:predicted ABC-type ATPase